MKTAGTISNIASLVDATKLARQTLCFSPWWRGQASSSWKLTPRIHRKKTTRLHETSLTAHFKSKAQTRHSVCPPSNDDAAWLFLMQHYRLATRLLDWSDSPLIALFFSVTERLQESGNLFALDPAALNRCQTGDDCIMTADYYKAVALFHAAMATEAPQVSMTLAVGANQVDTRMLAQSSQFTIHGTSMALNNLSNTEEFLIAFEIPSAAKENLREELFGIGIRESIIFPDLEHLAHDLEERYQFDKLDDQ